VEEAFFYYSLVASSLTVFVSFFARKIGYLELPFLISAVYIGWVIPQLWGIRAESFYADDLITLYIVAMLCLLATVIGWRVGTRRRWKVDINTDPLELKRLHIAAFVVTVVAAGAVIAIDLRPDAEKASSTWSGPIVILYFLSNLKIVSLALAGVLFIRTRSTMSIVLLGINLVLYLPAIVVFFRRRAMAEFAIGSALALWFGRRQILPRTMVISGLVAGTLIVFAVGELRELAKGPDGKWRMLRIEQVMAIDFLSATPFETRSTQKELTNALALVRLADGSNFHTWGAQSWNRFVFQYVPATFVGGETKRSLMIETGLARQLDYGVNHQTSRGSTHTGIGEAYLEFGYFGCIFFFLIALIVGRYWQLALRGDVWSQGLYTAAVIPAVITVTAFASYFFVAFLLYFVALNLLHFVLQKQVRPRRSPTMRRGLGRSY
jgi:hypothetical protein